MRRVVITGLGITNALGSSVEGNWRNILAGKSGVRVIDAFDVSESPSKVAASIVRGDGSGDTFNPDDWISTKDQRRMDTFIVYGVAAAEQAIRDSGWVPATDEDRWRTGVLIGSGIGGLPSIEQGAIAVHGGRAKRLSPFFIPASLINLVSGHVSIMHGFKGPNHAVGTAGSTGAHAIGDA
ncbi:MAG: beta-ketoacyl synthase N-terminal-like domain-containing protein, partial [Proteobacteria bacterium]|nr:beta-ketoacyl synthase N-terminal-like domain-containing protein [Pseudomonadota bacterium]